MNISLKIYTREITTGWDYSSAVEDITYTTSRSGSASSFVFKIIGLDEEVVNGSWVLCEIDGYRFFRGYIFKIVRDKRNVATITAHDQLRYLKTNHSYNFNGKSLDEIINKIANDFMLATGTIEKVNYKIPNLVCEDKSLFDMIETAITKTKNATGVIYVFYDNYGALELKQATELMQETLIGDQSLAVDYNYTLDIDKETYNQVRMVRENKGTGKADVFIYNDSENIKKWGLLQLYEKVDGEDYNEAMIKETGETELQYYNRELETIEFQNAIGIKEIRAGVMVPIQLSKIEKFKSPYYLICEKVSHKIKGNTHTMDISCNILSRVSYKNG